MGGVVSALAFPAPRLELSFYQEGPCGMAWASGGLLCRPDLVWLVTKRNEKIPAVFVKTPGARRTILYSHGNAEDLGIILDEIDLMARATGANVLAYDYVGYSVSYLQEGGRPSEAGCIRSVDAAWAHLTTKEGIPADQIIIVGRSIGSGPAVDLASRHTDSAGVLLISPISSGVWVVAGRTASRLLYAADIFRNYEKIGRITAPIAIVHGEADEVVPVSCGQHLHSISQNPAEPLWIPQHGHNDMPAERVEQFIADFVSSLGG